jgi:hypothetical protein
MSNITINSAADFKKACKEAKKHTPETWMRIVGILAKQGHGAILAEAIQHLSTDTGIRIVKPNNAREVERMTAALSGKSWHGN